MRKIYLKDRDILYIFFILVIAMGTGLLALPFCWKEGINNSFIDLIFTSVSAVCVTGLSTIDITNMTRFGQIILMLLIQVGGLGLITFSSMFLVLPRKKLTLANSKLIRNYFLEDEIVDPRYIIKIVLRFTIIIEIIGAIFIYISIKESGVENPLFTSLFHSVSAFCNAGFSTIPGGLVMFQQNLMANIVFMVLIITGGIGFMVLLDVYDKIRGRDKVLLLHTKVMFLSTTVLILSGTIIYFVLEYNSLTMEGLKWNQKLLASLFQSVTTRTAGFNTIELSNLTVSSKVVTLGYMLIGGGSGSTAGGLKVTTAFLIFCVLIQGLDEERGIYIFNRRINSKQLTRAGIFFGKAIIIVFGSILGLTLSESFSGSTLSFIDLTFEAFSAIGTVGLSVGITGELSFFSKIVLIFTMFAGRIGLFALVLPANQVTLNRAIEYPEGEVLIG